MTKEVQISKGYDGKDILSEMNKYFSQEGFVQIENFIDFGDLKKFQEKLKKLNFQERYDPIEFRYNQIDMAEIFDLDIVKVVEFFKSNKFMEFVEEITDIEDLQLEKFNLRMYNHKSYRILNDNQNSKDKVLVYFDVSDDWREEYGGKTVFTTHEDEMLYLSPGFNTLTLLFKPSEIMEYFKYINNKSEGKRIIRFEMEFNI